ncbi:L-lactate oxidase-like [Amblyomma americanum]
MAVTLTDMQRLGEAKMDAITRTYVSIGAGEGHTFRENTEAFKRLHFRPRILVDVEKVKTSTTVLGSAISFPVGLSPTCCQKLTHPAGEIGTAQAAQEAGTVMILSSLSTVSLEEVRASAPDCVLWQQVYIFRDRFLTESLVRRAAAQGYSAIVVTVDSPVQGDIVGRVDRVIFQNRLPEGLSYANLQASFRDHPSTEGFNYGVNWPGMDVSPAATLKDIAWLRSLSDLPIVVKGVLTAESAMAAHRHGAAAVIVSNHGGRQLDGTPATIDVLPEVVAAVGDCMEVYLDGGVRSGADVAKALSLGARAVFVGRPVLWGLAYDGKRGALQVLDILKEELERTIQLLGCSDVNDLCDEFVMYEDHCFRPLRSALSKERSWKNGYQQDQSSVEDLKYKK